jgi:hypothetical protein
VKLVPVPTTHEYLDRTEHHWFPFLKDISRRSKEPVKDLYFQIRRFDVQIVLAIDDNKTVAIAGLRRWMRGSDMIGEIVWATGKGMKQWQHLVDDIEKYLKETGSVECRPICRLGWSRMLKARGYRPTHMIMEKRL